VLWAAKEEAFIAPKHRRVIKVTEWIVCRLKVGFRRIFREGSKWIAARASSLMASQNFELRSNNAFRLFVSS